HARVPKLEIRTPGDRPTIVDLVSDRYLIGRNPQKCEIVIETPLVSQVHAELVRDSRQSKLTNFAIKDQNSTNGIYKQRQRIQAAPLKHNSVISLGPPELAAVVSLRYLDPPPWYVRGLKYAGLGGLGLIVLAIGAVILEIQRVPNLRPLPVSEQGPIEILAGDGKTSIGPSDTPKHTELNRLEDFGTYIPMAVIASEDSSFYWNLGIDPVGITRAIVTNVQKRELREGASTITQQLARNLLGSTYVGREDSPGRKWREMVAAIKLTFTYAKPEILGFYLNRVYLGNGVYGFQDAAKLYFNKSAADLDLSEAATLAGILPAPNLINPFRNRKLAIEYRDRVLLRLVNLGKISATEGERARRSVLKLNEAAKANLQGTIAPYFYSHVLDELYGQSEAIAKEGGLIVETYLDLSMQQAMNRTVKAEIAALGSANGFSQAAMISLDSNNGGILAMVGGANYQVSQFNRATQAKRQPGSTFKLFAYGAALAQGIPPTATFSCNGLNGIGNCENGGVGDLDMYRGFALSENAIAVRVAEAAGLPNVIKLAQTMGITADLQANTNLVLGGYEVTMLEMIGAFAAIANQGNYVKPHGIKTILDSRDCQAQPSGEGWRKVPATVLPRPGAPSFCRVIFDASQDLSPRPVLSSTVANTLLELMAGTVSYGTGQGAAMPQAQVVGKTGTSDQGRDLWFIGIVPARNLVTSLWLGNDQGVTNSSSAIAVQVWAAYMRQVL
ncbi:MAG: transglycosylase domain-containing protein, partial [Pseudanabaenaceae cyanobacterium bins.68]|nr:transglycosylase domain-containing protein [Pseudanabaenaceae cyanobacterium bins.68]